MKVQGHVYLANLLMDDLKKGPLTIPGLGTYTVPDVIKNAILNHPKAFRAGAIGPDCYPDIYFGQAIIHPRKNFNSGLWLKIMFEELLSIRIPEPSNIFNNLPALIAKLLNASLGYFDYNGQQALAFTLGFMAHYSADLFTHTYVNEYAEGPFPEIGISMGIEGVKNIMRHFALETYIDKKIPIQYKSGPAIEIEAPVDFIINCFGKYANTYASKVKSGLTSSEYNKYILQSDTGFESYSPLTLLLQLRNYLKKVVDSDKPYENSSNIFSYFIKTNKAGYFEKWMEDVNKAIKGWIITSDKIARALLNDDEKSLGGAITAVESWAKNELIYATGIPDFLINMMKVIDDIVGFLFGPWINKIKEFINELINNLIKKLIYTATGIDVDVAKDILKNPATYMNSPLFKDGKDTTEIVDCELGNFGKNFNTTQQTFKPFADSLNMAKLCLVGTVNLNDHIFNKVTPEKEVKKCLESIYATICLENQATAASTVSASKIAFAAEKATGVSKTDLASNKIPIATLEDLTVYDFSFGVALKNGKEYTETAYKLNRDLNGQKALSAKLVLPENILASDIKHYIIRRGTQSAALNVSSVKISGYGLTDQSYSIGNVYANNKLYFPVFVLNLRDEMTTVKLTAYDKQFSPATAVYSCDKLIVYIKTKDKFLAGTDDDVFFGVELKDNSAFKVLCDKPGKNDFEKGSLDSYILELPRHVKLAEIKNFYLEKKAAIGVAGDWYVEWAQVYLGNYDFGKITINKDMKNQRHYFMQNLNIANINTPLLLNPKIISFIKSLDESNQWSDAQFLTHPNCRKVFGFGQIDETVQTPPAAIYSKREFYLRKSTGQPVTPINVYVTGKDDNCELLVHYASCESDGALVAKLGSFKDAAEAKTDALKRGFADVGFCGQINGPKTIDVRIPTLVNIFTPAWLTNVNPAMNILKDRVIKVDERLINVLHPSENLKAELSGRAFAVGAAAKTNTALKVDATARLDTVAAVKTTTLKK